MEDKLISIIILAYNAEMFISRAVESAINQTYRSLEILIVDDGSTDETGKILDEYAEKDNRIRVIHTKNMGGAKARNCSVEEARGEFIATCDHDDYMHPTFIEKMYHAIRENDADMAICSWNNVDTEGRLMPWKRREHASCVLSGIEAQKLFLGSQCVEGFCWNKLFKKSEYDRNGIKYDEKTTYCDILANYKLIANSKKVVYLHDRLYDYYQLPTSCVHTANLKKHQDYLSTIKQVADYAAGQGLERFGEAYQIYRLNRHLFEMYKDRCAIDASMKKFYCEAYSDILDIPMLKKLKIMYSYYAESPLKNTLKSFYVTKYYKTLVES